MSQWGKSWEPYLKEKGLLGADRKPASPNDSGQAHQVQQLEEGVEDTQGPPLLHRFEVCPMGKPRMTQRDRWQQRPSVMRYRAFKDALREQIGDFVLPQQFRVVFRLPVFPSWSKSKKKRFIGQPHQQTPDVDNMVKALLDALMVEDKTVWRVDAEKRWCAEDEGAIEIYQLGG